MVMEHLPQVPAGGHLDGLVPEGAPGHQLGRREDLLLGVGRGVAHQDHLTHQGTHPDGHGDDDLLITFRPGPGDLGLGVAVLHQAPLELQAPGRQALLPGAHARAQAADLLPDPLQAGIPGPLQALDGGPGIQAHQGPRPVRSRHQGSVHGAEPVGEADGGQGGLERRLGDRRALAQPGRHPGEGHVVHAPALEIQPQQRGVLGRRRRSPQIDQGGRQEQVGQRVTGHSEPVSVGEFRAYQKPVSDSSSVSFTSNTVFRLVMVMRL